MVLSMFYTSGESEARMASVQYRRCMNIRSRAHSDVQCASPASQGDYCGKHYKKPIRFFDRKHNDQRNIYTRSQTAASQKILSWWKCKSARRRFWYQGPAIHDRSVSQNTTEVYSLEPIQTVPQAFFFSYADHNKNIWSFDIRSLLNIMSQGQALQNPYTREEITTQIVEKFRWRIDWLRKRRFPLLYGLEEVMTPEQEWTQKVLDVFMKLEGLGYLMNTGWYHDLTLEGHRKLYRTLYELWYYRLGLSHSQKDEICPGHLTNQGRLFRQQPEEALRLHNEIKWWKKTNLAIINSLTTKGTTKSNRGLGALYVVMGFVSVNESAAKTYPWIAESLGIEIED